VLFFNGFDKLNGIWETGSLEMEIQQQKISAPLASNVNTIVSSQNKRKTPGSKFFTNINHHSYNKQLVWNRFALHTAGRYVLTTMKGLSF
jgi:hypothetical protein